MKFERIATVALVFLACALSAEMTSAQQQRSGEDVAKNLIAAVEKLRGEMAKLREQYSWLARVNPPVGAVVAFGGDWPPKKVDGSPWSEDELGWKLCDGASIAGDAYKELRSVLGTDVVPDYRGVFLRGVDNRVDPAKRLDRGNRSNLAGDVVDTKTVGSREDDSTAAPKQTFKTSPGEGTHPHTVAGVFKGDKLGDGSYVSLMQGGGSSGVGGDGAHGHTIIGGDEETRPKNVSVNFIIKFQ